MNDKLIDFSTDAVKSDKRLARIEATCRSYLMMKIENNTRCFGNSRGSVFST